MEPWKKLKEELKYNGFRKVVRKTFHMPDGREDDFDIVTEGMAACILPFTPEGKVILTKQFRPGPEKVLLELPGGGIEPHETPEQAAARELLEETGYEGRIEFVGISLHSAYSSLLRYNFVALDCVRHQAP
ncbi:MAG: NUDIX hydrolase [Patescibacteria group bacterium]